MLSNRASPLPVTLASGSRYRRELLGRLLRAFDVCRTDVDESALPGESAAALALRLAMAKALASADRQGLVIGSDQTALCGTEILGKPHTAQNAHRQLAACSGRTVVFYTAVALRGVGAAGEVVAEDHVDITSVRFRRLTSELIERYVASDDALDCAGGFRIESAGPVLFEAVTSTDPTGLVGLPLCWLAGALLRHGADVLPTPIAVAGAG